MKTIEDIIKEYEAEGLTEYQLGCEAGKLRRFEAKSKDRATEVIGYDIKVKTGKNSAVSGTIVAVEYLGIRDRGRSFVPVYRVTIESGVNKIRQSFNLSTFKSLR